MMRIDSSFQSLPLPSALSPKETAGDVENDGDADDAAQASSVQQNAQQSRGVLAQGVGTMIDTSA